MLFFIGLTVSKVEVDALQVLFDDTEVQQATSGKTVKVKLRGVEEEVGNNNDHNKDFNVLCSLIAGSLPRLRSLSHWSAVSRRATIPGAGEVAALELSVRLRT